MHIRRSAHVFLALAALAFCRCGDDTPPAMPAPDAAPPDAPDPLLNFERDVRAAQPLIGMPAEWSSWMIARKARWANAYRVGAGGQTDWRIKVKYDHPIAYDPPFAGGEAEHMLALKTMLELQYPSWTFTFIPEGEWPASGPPPDVTVYLGNHGGSYQDGPTVHLLWEGILAHEFGHAVGLWHHYSDVTLMETPETEPPGERHCIMSRDGVTWGQTEEFLLRLGDPKPDADINAAMDDLNGRYPPHWPNVMGASGARAPVDVCPPGECLQDKR